MTTPDEIKAHNNAIMLKLEKETRLHQLFGTVYGLSERQTEVAAKALGDLFEYNGVTLVVKATGKAADSAESQALIKSDYSFLFPAENSKADEPAKPIDAALIASAAAGNITALGKITRQLGGDADKARQLVDAEKGKAVTGDTKDNHASNPWSRAGWSLKGQGACIRAMGTIKAAQIAAAVGCRIGATRPVM